MKSVTTEKPKTKLEGRTIVLRLAEVSDAEFILRLRLDGQLNRYLSAVEDDLEKQREWLRQYKLREGQGREYYFIAESKDGEPYGTIRLYEFVGDTFMPGSWVVKRGVAAHVGVEAVLLMYEFGFSALGFTRARFDVRKDNEKSIRFHPRFGARVVGADDLNVYFEITKDEFERAKRRYRKFTGGYVRLSELTQAAG
jgi:RimJ/RimL family protein N-acetyltransferase